MNAILVDEEIFIKVNELFREYLRDNKIITEASFRK